MYGLVNVAVHDLVVSKFGAPAWEQIKNKAGIMLEAFSSMEQYPDEVTFRLVGAASEVLGISTDEVMRAFGEHWVLYTGRGAYGQLFNMAGNSLRDFLFNLDALHTRVGQNFEHLEPPSFRFDTLNERTVRMHYHSSRKGLCPLVGGLITGLSSRFATYCDVEHPVCSRRGAEHCEFLLTFASNDW
jgi:predicted hydrocarbon binding protein